MFAQKGFSFRFLSLQYERLWFVMYKYWKNATKHHFSFDVFAEVHIENLKCPQISNNIFHLTIEGYVWFLTVQYNKYQYMFETIDEGRGSQRTKEYDGKSEKKL